MCIDDKVNNTVDCRPLVVGYSGGFVFLAAEFVIIAMGFSMIGAVGTRGATFRAPCGGNPAVLSSGTRGWIIVETGFFSGGGSILESSLLPVSLSTDILRFNERP